MADHPLKILQDALRPVGLHKKNWREALRDETGQNGEKLWKKIAQLSQGDAISVQLPDGRMSIPVTPTPDVQLRASIALAEMGFGRAVLQTEIVQAEQEAKEFESVRALSDEELEREAALILDARRVPELTRGTTEAEYTVDPLDFWAQVFYTSVQQDPPEE